MRRIPVAWIKEIEAGTEFGRKAAAVVAEIQTHQPSRTPGRTVSTAPRKPCNTCGSKKKKPHCPHTRSCCEPQERGREFPR